MPNAERSRLRRGCSYRYAAEGLALLVFFLIAAGLWPGDWAWIFAVAGFLGFVLFTRKALAAWNLDRLVFDRQAFRGSGRGRMSGSVVSSVESQKTYAEPQGHRVLRWESKTRFSSGHRGIG